MASPFSSTLRSLESEDIGGKGLLILSVLVVVTACAIWMAVGTVSVYSVSDKGRVEVDQTAHPVEPAVTGIIAKNFLTLGTEVHAGDELIVLDSTSERIRLQQEKARLTMNEQLLLAVAKELEAERHGTKLQAASAGASQQAARARSESAKALADVAQKQNASIKSLRDNELVTLGDALRSSGELTAQQAAAEQARIDITRLILDQKTTSVDRAIRAFRLEREEATLAGAVAISKTAIQELEFEIGRRTLRAVIDGVVADVNPAPPGTAVVSGQKLASVVPPGKHRIVASYSPADAIGRVRPGQTAVVRLDGFPWAQYGTHHAAVVRVASEPRDNTVRVELLVDRPNPKLPVTHGLTGRVEVEVEKVSPWTMLLRSLGALISTPTPPPPGPPAPGRPTAAPTDSSGTPIVTN
jgi:multidrug resistance efflux pump